MIFFIKIAGGDILFLAIEGVFYMLLVFLVEFLEDTGKI